MKAQLDRFTPHAVALFRIAVGFMFACHGAKTLFGLFGGKHAPAFGAWPSWWAAAIQLVAGVLVILGLGTRIAALVGSGSMAYAYFTVHQANALLPIQNEGEPAAMFCWALFAIAFVGPGAWAIGNLFRRDRVAAERTEAEAVTV